VLFGLICNRNSAYAEPPKTFHFIKKGMIILMKICIVGLGLIGGSFAKAIKQNTNHLVYGINRSEKTALKALDCGAIDKVATPEQMNECKLIILAITPDAAIEFVKKHAELISPETVVLDCCGIKRTVCNELNFVAQEHNFVFLGGHPMAGKEHSGFDHSTPKLFSNASMILTPTTEKAENASVQLESLFNEIGFGKVVVTTPDEHDKIVAYTSQLAHIASNAYIKSPTAEKHRGFSAGSFRDLTRVAYLDENMWSELFLNNKDNLLNELNFLIDRLNEYKTVLENEDREQLTELLRDGKEKKLKSN